MPDMPPMISVEGVSKIYGEGPGVRALDSVDLTFEKGEFSAVAGPSGSGKSTLLNIIGTLDSPTEGTIGYEGKVLTGLGEDELADFRLSRLGFVFQAYNLIPVLSALENVEYPLALRGVGADERRERALGALSQVGLSDHATRRPDLLSGGQQQRVAVARAIVHRPLVVLADEPTANLDSKTAVSLLDLMAGLNEEGITFLFSSHDPTVLERARRVVEIKDGRVAV